MKPAARITLKIVACLLALLAYLPSQAQNEVCAEPDTLIAASVPTKDSASTIAEKLLCSPQPTLITSIRSMGLQAVPSKHKKTVQTYIDRYALKERRFIAAMLRQQMDYFPMVEEYLREHDLPDE